ncbi:MAG: hypothetical protein ACM3TN_16005 [Alphaproteobacteria bacterium]
MKSARFVCVLFGLISFGLAAGSRLYAQSVMEKTMDASGSKVQVKIMAVKADIVSVKPYIKAKEGKKGNLWLDVVLKNTGSEPQAYNIFGQGKTMSGGWIGGALKAPKTGKLDPGKETVAQVKTGYKGEAIPEEIRVEVLPPQ